MCCDCNTLSTTRMAAARHLKDFIAFGPRGTALLLPLWFSLLTPGGVAAGGASFGTGARVIPCGTTVTIIATSQWQEAVFQDRELGNKTCILKLIIPPGDEQKFLLVRRPDGTQLCERSEVGEYINSIFILPLEASPPIACFPIMNAYVKLKQGSTLAVRGEGYGFPANGFKLDFLATDVANMCSSHFEINSLWEISKSTYLYAPVTSPMSIAIEQYQLCQIVANYELTVVAGHTNLTFAVRVLERPEAGSCRRLLLEGCNVGATCYGRRELQISYDIVRNCSDLLYMGFIIFFDIEIALGIHEAIGRETTTNDVRGVELGGDEDATRQSPASTAAVLVPVGAAAAGVVLIVVIAATVLIRRRVSRNTAQPPPLARSSGNRESNPQPTVGDPLCSALLERSSVQNSQQRQPDGDHVYCALVPSPNHCYEPLAFDPLSGARNKKGRGSVFP